MSYGFSARAESAYVPYAFPIDSAAVARTIILLAGPSGSGKSHLTHTADLPELRLDDFYRDHDEPGLPVVRDMVDWDDVASWNLPVAVDALGELATTGHTVVPCYDISRSRADGNHVVEVGDAPAVIAEGIFAPDLLEPCLQAGLNVLPIWLDRPRWLNFAGVSSEICGSIASLHPCWSVAVSPYAGLNRHCGHELSSWDFNL